MLKSRSSEPSKTMPYRGWVIYSPPYFQVSKKMSPAKGSPWGTRPRKSAHSTGGIKLLNHGKKKIEQVPARLACFGNKLNLEVVKYCSCESIGSWTYCISTLEHPRILSSNLSINQQKMKIRRRISHFSQNTPAYFHFFFFLCGTSWW